VFVPILPLRTARLELRMMRPPDAPVLVRYRGDPDVAKYQGWPMPYTTQDAAAMLADQDGLDDLALDRWVQVAIEHEGVVVGDLGVNLAHDGHVPLLGYTLAPAHRGKGFAAEAAGAMVDAIFANTAAHRIVATVDPENFASMRVIEPLGFEFEGIARRAELVRGEWLDDVRFALLREDRESWLARDRTPAGDVQLREITVDNDTALRRLRTFRFQERFVSPVATSFAHALIPDVINGATTIPWLRGIYAGDEPVGFMMTAEVGGANAEPYLWRLLVDRRDQGRGIGRAALRLLIDRLRADGQRALTTSWVDAPGGPEPFYRGLGFAPTGEIDDGEIVARLVL
jgi:RimJ/RimL family protein N-acetyltransferase